MTTETKRHVGTAIQDSVLVERRRDEIIRAASKVFAEKGYHQTTIKDICEVSGLGPGTIYNYVKKKEDILYLVYNKVSMMLSENLNYVEDIEDPLLQLRELLERLVGIALEFQGLILLMYQETGALDKESIYIVLARESAFVSRIEHIISRGREKGIIRSSNVKIGADIIAYLLAFLPLRRWNLKKKFTDQEIKAGIIDFIVNALCINGGGRGI